MSSRVSFLYPEKTGLVSILSGIFNLVSLPKMYLCKASKITREIPTDPMKSTIKIILVSIITLIDIAPKAHANDAHSQSISANSKARVITPISLENTGGQGLDFGVIALGTTESKIIVSAESTVPVNVATGDAVVVTSTPQKAAKFTVSGEVGQAYTITLPSSTTLVSGANSLSVANFTCSNGTGGNIGTSDLFYIGGELTIPAGAVPAVYQGTFNVTVAYN